MLISSDILSNAMTIKKDQLYLKRFWTWKLYTLPVREQDNIINSNF